MPEPWEIQNDNSEEKLETSVVESPNKRKLDLTNPRDLLVYFTNRFEETHNIPYVIEWDKETSYFKGFMARYGVDAPAIVDVLFDKFKGNINGNIITATGFAKGSKWIQDILFNALWEERNKKNKPSTATGTLNGEDFVNLMGK
jgi:hypothetical protein